VNGLLANVLAAKGPAGDGDVDFAKVGEEGDMFSGLFGGGDPFIIGFVVDFFLAGDVRAQGFAGEESVQTPAVVDVSFSIEEDPIGVFEDFLSCVDDTGLHE
jgi:hypothetical protein